MERFFTRLLGFAMLIIAIPFIIVLGIPRAIIKAVKRSKYRVLFTRSEQRLFFKAQSLLKMNATAIITYDSQLLDVAMAVEDARYDYQNIKDREKFDVSFTQFLTPYLKSCSVRDWNKVNNYFGLDHLYAEESQSSSISQASYTTASRLKNVQTAPKPKLREKIPRSTEDFEEAELTTQLSSFEFEKGKMPRAIMLKKSLFQHLKNNGRINNKKDNLNREKFYFNTIEVIPVENISNGKVWQLLA